MSRTARAFLQAFDPSEIFGFRLRPSWQLSISTLPSHSAQDLRLSPRLAEFLELDSTELNLEGHWHHTNTVTLENRVAFSVTCSGQLDLQLNLTLRRDSELMASHTSETVLYSENHDLFTLPLASDSNFSEKFPKSLRKFTVRFPHDPLSLSLRLLHFRFSLIRNSNKPDAKWPKERRAVFAAHHLLSKGFMAFFPCPSGPTLGPKPLNAAKLGKDLMSRLGRQWRELF